MSGERVKILRVITRLNVGGPAIHVALLNSGLDKERFESIIVSGVVGEEEKDMSDFAYERGSKPIFINEMGREIGRKKRKLRISKLL